MPRYSTGQLEQALRECHGMLYLAARRLKCSPNTIKVRLTKEPALQAVIDAEHGLATDTVELKLFQAASNGEPWAVQFYLRTKGRSRGYGDRQEITGSPLEPVAFSLRIDRDPPFDFDSYGKLFEATAAGTVALAGSNGVVHDD